MKKYNIFFIIYYLLLFLGIIICFFHFYYFESGKYNFDLANMHYNTCKTFINSSEDGKNLLIDQYRNDFGLSLEVCNELLQFKTPTNSAIYFFESVFSGSLLSLIFPYFVPLLIMFPIVLFISELSRSKFVKNFSLRNNYKGFVKYIYGFSYKHIFLIPLFIIILFLICALFTNNLDPSADVYFMLISNDLPNIFNSKISIIIYILILLLNMGIYINISLFILSKNKNFLISLIESYLFVYLIWCISEIIIGVNFQHLFNISTNYFSLVSIFRWRGIDNPYLYLFINILWFTTTLAMSLCGFKNKEKYIQMCER